GWGTGLTSPGACMGTPDYIAPEQATDSRTADIRADLYSLGCTLYCLLAGRPPFREDTAMMTILAHMQKEPQPLPQRRPEVPEALWQVVGRLLAKDPASRYQKPIEVAQALSYFIRPGAKGDAPTSPAPAPGAGSPGKGTVISADTGEIKEILREAPGKAAAGESPLTQEASPFANLEDTCALPTKANQRHEASKREVVWYGRWPVRAWVVAAVVLLFGVMAGVAVYRIQTDKGELVITTESDDVEVVIKQGGKLVRIIDTKTGKQVTLKSGEYELMLKDQPETLKLSLEKVTLKRGDTKLVTVERVEKPVSDKVELVIRT